MRKNREALRDEDWYDTFPGGVFIDKNPNPLGLKERAENFLSQHPEILDTAKEKSKVIKARATAHGTELLVASAVVAAGISAIVLYEGIKHFHKTAAEKHAQSFHSPARRKLNP